MINEEIREENKVKFLSLLNDIKRPDADISGLINRLENNDFFTAPATANSFRNYKGGLCEHALIRYENLKKLCEQSSYNKITQDSILITSLLADLGKVNYFEPTIKNKKMYHPSGKKSDELGNYDWVSEEGYAVKDPSIRFIFGTLGQNAERIITGYIPLTTEESAAIIHLHDDYENPNFNLASVYFAYPLAVLLNCADKITAFIDSREDILPF